MERILRCLVPPEFVKAISPFNWQKEYYAVSGHYELGNLQVVCRFVNRWKRDDSDDNFRRLIALVRGSNLPAAC